MFLAVAEAAKPAGGAAVGEVVIATAGAMLATGALLVLGLLHRAGARNCCAGPGRRHRAKRDSLLGRLFHHS